MWVLIPLALEDNLSQVLGARQKNGLDALTAQMIPISDELNPNNAKRLHYYCMQCLSMLTKKDKSGLMCSAEF